MLRIIIIDIIPEEIQHLARCLDIAMPGARVIAQTTDYKEGLRQIEDYRPDLVFLNISGMREEYFAILQLVSGFNYFLVYTAPDERYALKALRNQAFDYFVKPVTPEAIHALALRIAAKQEELLRQQVRLTREQLRRIAIQASAEEIIYEPSENILRLEAESNYTQIRLADKRSFLVSKTLKHFETLLCVRGFSFMRVHHSFIINLHHVSRFVKEEQGIIIMKDDAAVPLSKTKRNDFMTWLGAS